MGWITSRFLDCGQRLLHAPRCFLDAASGAAEMIPLVVQNLNPIGELLGFLFWPALILLLGCK